MREFVGDLYQRESRRVFSTLVRLLGDFDLAEETMHEAFAVALEQWQQFGAAGESQSVAGVHGPLQGDRRPSPPVAFGGTARGRRASRGRTFEHQRRASRSGY